MSQEPLVFNASTVDTTETIPFTINLTNKAGETKQMTFAAWGELPANSAVMMTDIMKVDGAGMAKLMDTILVPPGPEDWRDMVADPDWVVPATTISAVLEKLQERWAGRPTRRSPSS